MLETAPNDIIRNRIARKHAASPISDTAGHERAPAHTSALLSSDNREGIGGLRALAALMVFTGQVPLFVDLPRALNDALLAFPVFGIGVDLFLAISGYVTARSATRFLTLHRSWPAALVPAVPLWLRGSAAVEPKSD